MAGRLMDDDPAQALAHARAARALAGRVGAVREANGLVAYTAGEWSEALSELRAARRMTGEPDHLAVMADCERALGRPDRALLVVDDPQAKGLAPGTRVELMIVASGARRDMGQPEAAVAGLEVPALEGPVRAWTARLRYAYADALLEAGREDDARQWFARAAEVDELQETDAEERLLELDGMVLEDLLEDEEGSENSFVEESTTDVSSQVSGGPQLLDGGASSAEEAPQTSGEALEDLPSGLEHAVPAGAAAGEEPPAPEAAPEAPATGVPPVPMSAPDAEIPALGRAGSTGLGFVAPIAAEPEGTDDGSDDETEVPDAELRLFD